MSSSLSSPYLHLLRVRFAQQSTLITTLLLSSSSLIPFQGLFAIKPDSLYSSQQPSCRKTCIIKDGSIIGVYAGVARARHTTLSEQNHYLFDINQALCIDGSGAGNVTAYMNHANTPREANVKAVKVDAHGELLVLFFADCNICAGEELCYQYGSSIVF